jgi:hypothetical protein
MLDSGVLYCSGCRHFPVLDFIRKEVHDVEAIDGPPAVAESDAGGVGRVS